MPSLGVIPVSQIEDVSGFAILWGAKSPWSTFEAKNVENASTSRRRRFSAALTVHV